jgi:hypothetical protein
MCRDFVYQERGNTMKEYKINGKVIKSWYAGIDNYNVDDQVCYDLGTLARWVGVDVETLKDEMWRQR